MIWLDIDAFRSMWSFIASHDLVGRVKHIAAPYDDPATELFLEVGDDERVYSAHPRYAYCSMVDDALP
jgi:hypothetical protein